MSNVVRIFALPSISSAQLRVVEHVDHWELIIIEGSMRRRRRLEPKVAKALIESIRANTDRQKEN
jgi:hypothetical protein